jgi:transcriptional regulator with XRE-family HTH domain
MERGCGMAKRGPDPQDIQVGQRIRALRLERGMSQTDLAKQLGLTFQQVQKYEKGSNRIGAGRLHRIAEILGVPVATLFASSDEPHEASKKLFEFIDTAASVRIMRAFSKVRDPKVQQALTRLAEAIADEA